MPKDVTNPCVKTLPSITPRLHGRLLIPETPMYGDQDMYAKVREAGKAVVHIYDDDSIKTFSPGEFEQRWCGD